MNTAFFAVYWQSRPFWMGLIISSLIAACCAFKLMLVADPSLNVEISFSREDAIASAEKLQAQVFPDLHTEKVAVTFATDQQVQNYIELEGGGLAVLNREINNVDIAPYAWNVRRFSEAQEKELTVSYAPTGAPLAFFYKLPQQESGAALSVEAARKIAETGILQFWGKRFSGYKELNSSLNHQVSGRIDHVFTYERKDVSIGELKPRVDVVVAGNQLIEIKPFNFIPEEFNQRFNEMRSLNNHIHQIADFLMKGVLGFALLLGGIWLYLRQQLKWRAALVCGFIVSFGLAAAQLCGLPMVWMHYSTTSPEQTFLLQQIVAAGSVFIMGGVFFTIIFMVAEGLSRMAFALHPRVFDIFRAPVATSGAAWGRVLGGYIWAGFFLLYAGLFVWVSREYFGWWSPSNLYSDPNILASWRPALVPIFTALQAGAWEECVFRAVPLSLAVLVGKRFGREKLVILVVLVLQAVIFAGAHANYPQLPGYNRVVELLFPALVFGVIFLRFGLVPVILAHFIYDLVLMSIPIFVSDDSRLIIDKALVIFVGLIPLLILFFSTYKQRALNPLDEQWRNGEPVSIPAAPINPIVEPTVALENLAVKGKYPLRISKMLLMGICLLSVISLSFYAQRSPTIAWPEFSTHREQALILATEALAKKGVVLGDEWRSTVLNNNGWGNLQRDFIWREAGKEKFESLLQRYLDISFWRVSWRKFGGPVEQRSEQWIVMLYPNGELHEIVHILPEAEQKPSLTREQAISTAAEFIAARNWGDVNLLEQKVVQEIKRTARSDWFVVYADNEAFNEDGGQAVIRINISGDEITSFSRTIDVPEQWQREQAEKNAKKTPFNILAGVAFVALLLLALSPFLRKYSGAHFNLRVAIPWAVIPIIAVMADWFLWQDPFTANFQTTMSWAGQWWGGTASTLLGALFMSAFTLLAVQAIYAVRPPLGSNPQHALLIGGSLALLFAALYAMVKMLPTNATPHPDSMDYAGAIPWLATVINGIKNYHQDVVAILLVAIGVVQFTRTKIRYIGMASLALLWLAMSVMSADEIGVTLAYKIIVLLAIFCVIELVRRQEVGVAIAFLGLGIAFDRFVIIFAPYPLAWLHALIAAVVVALITSALVVHWYRYKPH